MQLQSCDLATGRYTRTRANRTTPAIGPKHSQVVPLAPRVDPELLAWTIQRYIDAIHPGAAPQVGAPGSSSDSLISRPSQFGDKACINAVRSDIGQPTTPAQSPVAHSVGLFFVRASGS
jgi:hypothetical protein